ncbi:MAG: hypothetical protein ACR2GY_05160 [Phycisphaerales bacterium]
MSDPCEDTLKGNRPAITEISCSGSPLDDCLNDSHVALWIDHLKEHGCDIQFKCYSCGEEDGPNGLFCKDNETIYLCADTEHLCCVVREELLHAMQSDCIARSKRILRDIPVALDCEDKFLQWLQDEGHGQLVHPSNVEAVHNCLDCLAKELQAKYCSRCCHEGGGYYEEGIDPFDCAWEMTKNSCGECAQLQLGTQPFDPDLFKQFLGAPAGEACKTLLLSCAKVPYPSSTPG